MRQSLRREVEELFGRSRQAPGTVITEADFSGLPDPVQRSLRYALVSGRGSIRTVRLKQKGFFRNRKDQGWMPLVAEQYFTTDPPAFLWHGTIRRFPLPPISARDTFTDGRGRMRVTLSPGIKLADQRGPELSQGELLRYLGEIPLFPTAWLCDYIQWQGIDSRSARADIRHQDVTASAVLHVDERGRVTRTAAERYLEEKGQHVLRQWSGRFGEYRDIGGLRIPATAEAVWHLPSGDFSYFRAEITEIEYDRASPY